MTRALPPFSPGTYVCLVSVHVSGHEMGDSAMRIHFYTDCHNVEDEDTDKWDTGPLGDQVTCVRCIQDMITDRVLVLP